MAKSSIKRDPYLDKADFLTKLISMDKEQINQFIKANGKPIKRIFPFIVMDKINITEDNNNEQCS